MSIDLMRLSPAPWEADGFGSDEHGWGFGVVCKDTKGQGDFLVRAAEMSKADAEFCALARNAFDVMMRRGWWSVPQKCGETWIAMNAFAVQIERGGNTGIYFVSPDPFTCLVEADRWFKEHVDAKPH